MTKNKLKKFAELDTFQRVFQPPFEQVMNKDYPLKGKWGEQVFRNANPLVLELGCGKGEYTVSLAQHYKNFNFIGVDIKGARLWNGARIANERDLKNAAFLRTRIEFIESFFAAKEVHEIWITFPDPQLKKRRNKKRLTGSLFLNKYASFLRPDGIIHLKTDNAVLYQYTRSLVNRNELPVIMDTEDLYAEDTVTDARKIQTYYERKFLDEGLKIHYLSFTLPANKKCTEPDETR